jgi:hypothetical protein
MTNSDNTRFEKEFYVIASKLLKQGGIDLDDYDEKYVQMVLSEFDCFLQDDSLNDKTKFDDCIKRTLSGLERIFKFKIVACYFMFNDLLNIKEFTEQTNDNDKLQILRSWLRDNCEKEYTIDELVNLKELRLHDNDLVSLPPEIGLLTNLQHLGLEGNKLTSIPPEIGRLNNLLFLYLGVNELTSIPPEIGQLTNLQTLNLSNNKLTSLPPEIGRLTNLQKLYLSNNKLTSLPPEIGRLTNLQSLWLRSNNLTSISPEIGRLTNLIFLNLSCNNFSEDIGVFYQNKTQTAAFLKYLSRKLEISVSSSVAHSSFEMRKKVDDFLYEKIMKTLYETAEKGLYEEKFKFIISNQLIERFRNEGFEVMSSLGTHNISFINSVKQY